ncbi:winged helix-turn-helix transcriptional regulator [Alteromonas facilis]|uniref:winged helix-turn-helix transcriptional regulator n=1 Tax=Alteromonas facilis TaxID=2048004 RepID=UPI000F5CDA02|nr:winged helix-turn-helix transcriptional regulator [Alteromonas facilis]
MRKQLTSRQGFMPKAALDFASMMENQAKPVYQRMGITIPVITTSTIMFIQQHREASLLDIARGLDISHQLAAQRVKTLLKLEVIVAQKDSSDKRKTNYSLTELGEAQCELIEAYMQRADAVFKQINDELGFDLQKVLINLSDSFHSRSLLTRFFNSGD